MSNITCTEYWTEVKSLAEQIAKEAMLDCDNDRDDAEEQINDSILHETIDGHEWIIYNAYNLNIYQLSDNSDYLIDNLGEEEAAHALKSRGLSGLHNALAFWALYADVSDAIPAALDDIEETLEEQE